MRFCAPDAGSFSDEAFHGIRFCVPDAAPMPMPFAVLGQCRCRYSKGDIRGVLLIESFTEARLGSADADVDCLDGTLHGIRFCIPDAAPMPTPLPFLETLPMP